MKQLASVIFIVALICAFLVWVYYPEIPNSVWGWITLIILGIPAWLFWEWLGDAVLQSDFLKKRSSVVRILIGIPAVCILIAVMLLLMKYVHQFISFVDG